MPDLVPESVPRNVKETVAAPPLELRWIRKVDLQHHQGKTNLATLDALASVLFKTSDDWHGWQVGVWKPTVSTSELGDKWWLTVSAAQQRCCVTFGCHLAGKHVMRGRRIISAGLGGSLG